MHLLASALRKVYSLCFVLCFINDPHNRVLRCKKSTRGSNCAMLTPMWFTLEAHARALLLHPNPRISSSLLRSCCLCSFEQILVAHSCCVPPCSRSFTGDDDLNGHWPFPPKLSLCHGVTCRILKFWHIDPEQLFQPSYQLSFNMCMYYK